MQSAQKLYSISEAAQQVGVSSETLRRWERSGKIKVGRTPTGNRIFTQEDILKLKEGFSSDSASQNDEQRSHNSSISLQNNPTQPYTYSSKIKLDFKTVLIVLLIFVSLASTATTVFTLFKFTPYPHQAVLGIETFVAPALEESAPLGNILSLGGKFIGGLTNIFKGGSFVVPLLGKSELATDSNLRVEGNANIAKDIEGLGNLKIKGTASVGKLITGIVDLYLIENDGTVQSTLEIKSTGDISLKPQGNVVIGNLVISNSSLSGINNLTSSNLAITNNETIGGTLTTEGTIETKKDLKVDSNITLTGSINSNTLNSTSLTFAGSSPSISASTTNTGISLNANGTGPISIGNSSTGDIYLGGGTTSGTRCLISNSSANLNCSGDITAVGKLYTTGGYLKTTSTTGYVFNDTATTLNIGGAGTTISLGASTGTTTVNNALTATGATTLSSTLGVTGTTSLNGAVNIGSVTTNDIAVNGRITTSIIPKLTGNVDLGSSSLKFNNLYSNTVNTASTNTSGQAIFTQNPASTAIADASVLINPTTVTNNTSALLGIAVGGVEKARIDNNGNLTLQGNLTLSGTISNTSTTTSGDIYAYTDTSLTATGANLSNFTFKNNNGAGLSTVNGITVTEQAANAGGTNTSNLINLSAAANGTVNGVNISSATGFTNFFKTPTFNLDSSGNITGVVGLTATNLTGTIQTASQTNITAVGTLTSLGVTGNINSASGSLQTNAVTRIDNSGNLTAGTGSFGGAVTPSLDATYDFGSAVKRWGNAYFSGDVTAGDVVFKNKFRMTEDGNGIDLLNPKGEKIASFDENGNFWVKGEIKHGTGN